MPIEYQNARSKLREHLAGTGTSHHMFYGPTSEQYWNEPLKLVAVNMEPYGYERNGLFEVKRDVLIDWIDDAGGTGTRTTRYTLAIFATALCCFHRNILPSPDILRHSFSDRTTILDSLDRTVYYNIRSQSNYRKAQDYAAISAVGHSEIGRLVWAEIIALKPDVIVVGGKAALSAISGLLRTHEKFDFRGHVNIGSVLIQSISHPSRPNYTIGAALYGRLLNGRMQSKNSNPDTLGEHGDFSSNLMRYSTQKWLQKYFAEQSVTANAYVRHAPCWARVAPSSGAAALRRSAQSPQSGAD